VKRSPSRKGFHFIAWHSKGFTLKKLLEIRRRLYDDKARIYFDETKGRAINVLFDKKRVKII
jgi:hypothetical protein